MELFKSDKAVMFIRNPPSIGIHAGLVYFGPEEYL